MKEIKPEINHKDNILIMGLGVHGGGVASARFFANLKAKIIITDLKKENELKESIIKLKKINNIKYILGKHRKIDFKKTNLIIRNPAVPNDSLYLNIARKNNIPIHTDISWFVNFVKQNRTKKDNIVIIGITGTKGKSTTASLLNYVLNQLGKKTILAGNIRKSPLDYIKIKKYKNHINLWLPKVNYIILEMSSWHLESLSEHKLSPDIAVITNILPDHLNRYKNFKEYAKSKKFIYKYQTKKDLLFINNNDKELRSIKNAPSKIIKIDNKNKKIYYNLDFPIENANIIESICECLNLNKKSVQKIIKSFPGLEGRMEKIANIKGVLYINNTCATQPESAIFSIDHISKNIKGDIILIAGGSDKNLDYKNFAKTIIKKVKVLILLKGNASRKISGILKMYDIKNCKIYKNIESMKKAVDISNKQAKKGDCVLLSPASASFNMFKHEFDRGEKFKKYVLKLKNENKTKK